MDINDLDKLINEVLDKNCDPESFPEICSIIANPFGRKRVFEQVKMYILRDGMDNVLSALAQIELDLNF